MGSLAALCEIDLVLLMQGLTCFLPLRASHRRPFAEFLVVVPRVVHSGDQESRMFWPQQASSFTAHSQKDVKSPVYNSYEVAAALGSGAGFFDFHFFLSELCTSARKPKVHKRDPVEMTSESGPEPAEGMISSDIL